MHTRACRLDNGGRHGCNRNEKRWWSIHALVRRMRATRVVGIGVGGASLQVPRRARPHRVSGPRVRSDAAAVGDRTDAGTTTAGIGAAGTWARVYRSCRKATQDACAASRGHARARSRVVGMSWRGWLRVLSPHVVSEVDRGRARAGRIAQRRREAGRSVGDATAACRGLPEDGSCRVDRTRWP